MTTTELYTPLEAFLFFQSLQSFGTEASSFSKISNVLKQNEFVRESNSYQPDRLGPVSLQQLYLELLKEDQRGEGLQGGSPTKGGDHNPRKRKLSTPLLESVDGAGHHVRSLPQLVNRLYARYREHVFNSIREDERQIQLLQKDIREIENGEWDARLQAQENASKRDSKGISSIQTLLRDDVEVPVREGAAGQGQPEALRLQSGISQTRDSATHHEVNGYAPSEQAASQAANKAPEGITQQHSGQYTSDVPSTYSPRHDTYRSLSRPPSQSRMDGHDTYLPPMSGPVLSPSLDTNRRLPHPPPQIPVPPLASPRLSNSSPIILPPPPGMLLSSGSPAGSLDALADMAGQQYRPGSSAPSPRQGQFYSPQSHPNQLPQPRNYMQRSYPYYDAQVPYAQHYPPYVQSPLPPYQSPNQGPYPAQASPATGYWSGSRQNGAPPYQSPLPSYPQFSSYSPGQVGFQQGSQAAHVPQDPHSRLPVNATPLSSGTNRRQSHRPTPIDTSVSSTRWKHVSLPVSATAPGSPSPPGPDAVSPISDKAPSPSAALVDDGNITTLLSDPNQSVTKGSKTDGKKAPVRVRGNAKGSRGGRGRGGSTRGRGARAASTASSALDVSGPTGTRSQSIISHTDELSFDNTTLGSSQKIKPEPPATPATATDDNASIRSTPVGDPIRSSGRTRRDTVRSLEPPLSGRPSGKRKRADTIEETPDLPTPTIPSRPNHVLASRNFPRISAPIMNDITTHKLASMFAKPVTEREAPGYKNVIHRPQDLKSIRLAIGAGSRAVAAIDDSGSPAVGGSKGSASIWVEKTADVIPPKGIVNSTQLEKELCRVFANAVMYNRDPKHGLGPAFRTRSKVLAAGAADDDGEIAVEEEDGGGVVRDTREMFETVEKSLSEWRAAERAGEDGRIKLRGGEEARDESEMDELAADDAEADDEGAIIVKKRKKG
ncbi:hypothetical protein MMC13_000705 [Lambiella insularis]|nr:hypothetical protein [Lambiella insularis]